MNLSDRILVIYEGSIVADLNPKKSQSRNWACIWLAQLLVKLEGSALKRPDKLKETILSFLPSILAIVVGFAIWLCHFLISNPGQALGFSTV